MVSHPSTQVLHSHPSTQRNQTPRAPGAHFRCEHSCWYNRNMGSGRSCTACRWCRILSLPPVGFGCARRWWRTNRISSRWIHISKDGNTKMSHRGGMNTGINCEQMFIYVWWWAVNTQVGGGGGGGGVKNREKRCLTAVILLQSPCFTGTTALWL